MLNLREGNLSTAQESCEKNINIKDAKLVTKVDQNQVTKIFNEPGKSKQTADHSKQTCLKQVLMYLGVSKK